MTLQEIDTLAKYHAAVALFLKTGASYHQREVMKYHDAVAAILKKQIPPAERNLNNSQSAIDWSR